ncbi:hypothetical protein ABK040_016792, partial [Willaertia magna]
VELRLWGMILMKSYLLSLQNFKYIQEYYEQETKNIPCVHTVVVNHRRLDETLDHLHSYVLEQIFRVVEQFNE